MSTKVFLLAAFFFSHIFTGVHLSKPCPKQCSCHSSWLRGVSSVVVDCSKRGLTSIPTKGVSRYVTSLVLNDNLITEIPRNAFKRYRYLREIYLYKNFIASIHPQAFRGLRRLKELSLHSNQLSVIENGTFAGLRRLDRLYLFTNLLQGINNGVFQGLTNLKTLYLHENLLRSIPPQSFKELKKLNLLTLHRNHIQVLHTGSMEGLHSVTSIFLHQNKIRKVENNAFAGCKNVVKLQLGINQLSNITKEMFIGLESLKELYLDKNQIGLIENPDVFTHVSHITKLVLLGNRLTDLLPNTFERLYNLRILSISGNQLRELRPGMFGGLPLLHTLLLQENKIQWIEPYAFQGLTALQRLYLFRNEIFYVQERTFFGLFALVELNLGVNKIEGLAKDAFLGLPRLVSLQLNSNFINTIRFGTFTKLRSLYRLVLYFNKITRVEKGAFDDCKRLGSLLWYPPLTLVKSSRTLKEIPSNDFKCDCQAVWLKQWLTQKTSKVGSIFCNGPAALKGRNVTEVDDEHFICAPIFMATEPKLTLLKSGKTAQIRCNVNALAEYTWIKNGSVLTNQFKTFQTNTGALFVHNVTEADSGEYICLVKTENATLAGSSIVKVGAQPSIIGNKEEIVDVQKENENVVLICPNEGFPKPLVFWHYAGKLIQDGSEERFIGFDGRLILTKMTAKNAGVYVCTANNEFGMDKKSFYLRVSAEKESYCQPTCGTGYECKMKYTCQCSKERALNDGMCSSTVEGRSFGSGDGPENNEIGDNEANDVEDDLDNDEFSRESFTDVSHSIMTTTSSTTPKRGGPVV